MVLLVFIRFLLFLEERANEKGGESLSDQSPSCRFYHKVHCVNSAFHKITKSSKDEKYQLP